MSDPELEELFRLCLIEEGLSVTRHDLRNRLAAVRNAAFYLRKKTEKSTLWEADPRFPSFYGIIETELEAAEALLTAVKVTADLPRVVEAALLEPAVRRGLATLRRPPTVHVTEDFAQTVPHPLCAPEIALLTRCLALNSLEAVDGRPSGSLQIGIAPRAGGVCLWVQDDGPGMTEATRSRALLPFETTKPGHLGVGLNIAARLAQRHRGHLELKAANGGGLRVEVTLS
jgi:signal transduction histidine kinase